MKRSFGFTLVELLVVIAIIGILSTMAMVSLVDVKAKARDTKRTADISTLQRAIELGFVEDRDYTEVLGSTCINSGSVIADCNGSIVNFISSLDTFHDPNGDDACVTPAFGCDFAISENATTPLTYQIGFWLEKGAGELGPGKHYLTQIGLQ
ncbi:MAG TPA: hypothetical protein DDW36_02845 [Candidatus Magasanikbacteria bacterium]|nr:hypothetical protein [Candidatus Magasanikbacteria bacterium]